MRTSRILWALALVALGAQVYMACFVAWAWGTTLGGDESYYVGKAGFIRDHGALPTQTESGGFVGERWASWGDVRPPGYPVTLAFLGVHPESTRWARVRVTAFQAVLTALSLSIVALLMRPLFRSPSVAAGFALVLAVQPWSFGFAPSLLPDPINSSLLLIGCILSAAGLLSRPARVRPALVGAGAALLACSTFFRIEDLLFASLITATGLAVTGSSFGWQRVGRGALIALACWFLAAGIHAFYWKHVTGTWQVVKTPGEKPAPGLYSWLQTFVHSEKSFTDVYWAALGGVSKKERLPSTAYRNPQEKARIAAAFDLIAGGGAGLEIADEVFRTVASERRAEMWTRSVAIPATLRILQLWLHTHTNSQLLAALGNVDRGPRRVILGTLLLIKLAVLSLALFAVVQSVVQYVRAPESTAVWTVLVLSGAAYVVTKSVYVGVVAGVPEHRYLLGGWSMVLAMAGVGLAHLTRGPEPGAVPASDGGDTDR